MQTNYSSARSRSKTKTTMIVVASILLGVMLLSFVGMANGVFGDEANIFKKRNEANIIDPEFYNITDDVISGVTIKVNEDGAISLSGTATSDIDLQLCKFTVKATGEDGKAVNYMISGADGGSSESYYIQLIGKDANGNNIEYVVDRDHKAVNIKSLAADTEYQLHIVIKSGTKLDNVTLYPVLVQGVDAGSFYA